MWPFKLFLWTVNLSQKSIPHGTEKRVNYYILGWVLHRLKTELMKRKLAKLSLTLHCTAYLFKLDQKWQTHLAPLEPPAKHRWAFRSPSPHSVRTSVLQTEDTRHWLPSKWEEAWGVLTRVSEGSSEGGWDLEGKRSKLLTLKGSLNKEGMKREIWTSTQIDSIIYL